MFFQPASVLPFLPLQFFIYKLTYTMLDTLFIPLYSFYMEEEYCEAAIYEVIEESEEPISHECWEPKGHDGAHRCVSCSEQF